MKAGAHNFKKAVKNNYKKKDENLVFHPILVLYVLWFSKYQIYNLKIFQSVFNSFQQLIRHPLTIQFSYNPQSEISR